MWDGRRGGLRRRFVRGFRGWNCSLIDHVRRWQAAPLDGFRRVGRRGGRKRCDPGGGLVDLNRRPRPHQTVSVGGGLVTGGSHGCGGATLGIMMPVAPCGQWGSRGVEIMDGATVSVAVVASRTEAELIVGMLRSNGLRAAVAADDAGGQEPQLQLQGVRVLVAPSEEAEARQLIAEAKYPPAS